MSRFLFTILILLFIKAEAQNTSALNIGDSLFALGDYSKAILIYHRLPNNEDVNFKLAKSYEALGNNPKAIEFYNLVISENPKIIQAKYNYARLLFKVAKFKKSDSLFIELVSENPDNPNFTYQRGLIKEKQKDSTAIQFFQKTYKIDSNHINAIYKIAKLKLEKRKFSEAKPLIEKGLVTDSLSIRFLTLQALNYYYTGNFHQAIKTYNGLIKLGKKDAKTRFNLADSYYKVLAIEKAIDQYTILINEFDDKNDVYHFNLGLCYLSLHYSDKAKKQFEQAIALKYTPLDNEYYALARVYKREGNKKEEIKMLKKAVSENPKNEILQYQLVLAYDNFYIDKKVVLAYYEKFLKRFGETGKFRDLAKHRASELKREIHFED